MIATTVRRLCLAMLLVLLGACGPGQRSPGPEQFTIGDDLFVGGGATDVSGTRGDLIAAGDAVRVNGAVGGSAVVAAREVRIGAPVRQDAYLAGRHLALTATIAGNARMAGARIDLARDARIAGNATIAARDVNIAGDVDGYLLAAGRRIYIDGEIGGDARLSADEIELGPNARIAGTVHYRSKRELTRASGAEIGGKVERLSEQERPAASIFGLFVWSLGLIVLAAILLSVFPGLMRRASETAGARFGRSLLIGLIAFVAIPVALVIAMFTVIGLPLGLLLLLAYPMLLVVGYVVAGIALGDTVLARTRPTRELSRGSRIAAAAVALIVLGLAAGIPFLGGVIAFVALLVGTGALLQQARRPAAA